MARLTFTVGRLLATPVRRALKRNGLAFEEDKGWLSSQFIVSGEARQLLVLKNRLQEMTDD